MYCRLCGKHLYQNISFTTLFKWKYTMHHDCEQQQHTVEDVITFPLQQKLVDYMYLFDVGYETSDVDYLFTHYYHNVFEEYILTRKWSILIDLDDITDNNDLNVIVHLATTNVLMVSMFYEQYLSMSTT